ncbi:hypothetical protein [Clostridium sp. HMP27]|uniref:hypothetical protein n=1 Tax=Clostridium sp. HMP27 TaxID=1487921 RepID=UPI00052E1E1D|nr:hypothetical protein [Clostridium sp. HMP27]KGK88289.1 hypothetical protein DP68_07270 [Clostridium sp. HMP27]
MKVIKKIIAILAILFIFPASIYAKDYNNIEIYDIKKDQLIKTVHSNSEIENLVISYLQGIDGIYAKLNPIPKEGYAIKVSLESPLVLQNEWINNIVDQAIIVLPKEEGPKSFFIIFEKEDKLMCFTFKGDVEVLLEKLQFKVVQ